MALGLCLHLFSLFPPTVPSSGIVWNKTTGEMFVFEAGTSSWKAWWSRARSQINRSAMWEHLAPSYTACLTDSTDTRRSNERAPCMSHCRSTGPCIMQEAFSLLPLSVSPSAPCSAVKIDQQTLAFSSSFFFFCLSLSLGSHQVQRLLARAPHFFASVFVLPRLKRVGVYTLFSACVHVCVCIHVSLGCFISLHCTQLPIKVGY